MTVLVLARDLDPSADRMVQALGERGVPVFRTDLAAFPQELMLDARLTGKGWDGVLATEHHQVRLSEIRSVWYRHPSHFVLPEGMSGPERRHAAAEARCGLAGVLSSLDVLWVNYPARESDALKPPPTTVDPSRAGLHLLATHRAALLRPVRHYRHCHRAGRLVRPPRQPTPLAPTRLSTAGVVLAFRPCAAVAAAAGGCATRRSFPQGCGR